MTVDLDRTALVALFDALAAKCEQRGVRAELFVVGGAAMALAYSTTRATKDLDAVFEPKEIVYQLASEVAAESTLDLPGDWLNDGVKSFLPGPDPSASVAYERPGLTVRVASPRYLFTLKSLAAREADEEDLLVLFRECGYGSASEALEDVAVAYPAQPIRPATQYLVEEVAGAVLGGREDDAG
ncbi:MAG: DUF6036 family nucleotidyltransferase [Actinomycetota bacterium]